MAETARYRRMHRFLLALAEDARELDKAGKGDLARRLRDAAQIIAEVEAVR